MQFQNNSAKHFKIDKELVIVFLLVGIAGTVFFFVSNQRAFLNFFYIPVLVSAYFFGKRHATSSAVFSIILISLIAFYYPSTFFHIDSEFYKWLDIGTWGSFLIITAYYMGLLYEKKESANREVKKTYQGIIEMMSMIIDSADKAGQSHSYRVSVISGMIARDMGLSELWVENIRIAALLHDLGKLDVGSEVFNKLSKLSSGEYENMQIRTTRGPDTLEPMCGKILDIMPSILYQDEKFDGSGKLAIAGDDIPLGARIIAVADAYDSLVYDSPYRKSLTPSDAEQEIIKLTMTHFDPRVIKAFSSILPSLEVGGPFITQVCVPSPLNHVTKFRH